MGDNYRPFDADALTAYSEDTGGQVSVADAQGALEMLREKGLVIRLERGRYTLDDPSLADWFLPKSYFPKPCTDYKRTGAGGYAGSCAARRL